MTIPVVAIKKFKDGKQVARFRDTQGLVRTSTGQVNWVKAADIRTLTEYWIELQKEQVAAGLGSDGAPMPPLKGGGGKAIFIARRGGRPVFQYQGYAQFKASRGLKPMRDLYGPGKDGHMLDDIRINYLDDKRGQVAITRLSSRTKARANENRYPWWGLSPQSTRKLATRAGELFPQSVADALFTLGLIGAQALGQAKRFFQRVA